MDTWIRLFPDDIFTHDLLYLVSIIKNVLYKSRFLPVLTVYLAESALTEHFSNLLVFKEICSASHTPAKIHFDMTGETKNLIIKSTTGPGPQMPQTTVSHR